jgi:hypothetical protein
VKLPSYLMPACALAAFGILLWGMFSAHPHDGLLGESDKADHLLAFAVASALSAFALKGRLVWLCWLFWIGSAYGMEWLQGHYLPKRTFDTGDVWANLLGVSIAFSLWLLWRKMHFKTV